MPKGLVVAALGSTLTVLGEDGKKYTCVSRGKFRISGVQPLAGDRVVFEVSKSGACVITEIEPRKNSLVRPLSANVDRLIIIVSAAPPVSSLYMTDCLTAFAEYKGIGPVIAVNKVDLADASHWRELYASVGYRAICVSAATGEGIEEFRALLLLGGIAVLCGNSGVGKSSLINAAAGLSLETGEISEKIGRGRNTTRHTSLLKMGEGFIADTPGYSSFDAVEMEMTDCGRLERCFPEFEEYLGRCRWSDCSHVADEGCAVRAAAGSGGIWPSRYESYVRLYEKLKTLKSWEK